MLNTPIETEHRVLSMRQFLPAGPMSDGKVRREDLVQIYCDPGGFRTLTLKSITKVR